MNEGNYPEGTIYQQKLDNIIHCAGELKELIDSNQELPSWVQNKIVLAEYMVEAPKDYMKIQKMQPGMSLDEKKGHYQKFFTGVKNKLFGKKKMSDLNSKQKKYFFNLVDRLYPADGEEGVGPEGGTDAGGGGE